jgi:hypothetical protein
MTILVLLSIAAVLAVVFTGFYLANRNFRERVEAPKYKVMDWLDSQS